jgi:aryl-phospho-beta-D-glucosidase BglC (GH1 family)
MKLPPQTAIIDGKNYTVQTEINLVVVGSTPQPTGNGYTVMAGKIRDMAGAEVQLRGINHFGFNADGALQPMYLWQMGWKEQLAQIKSLGFNAIRCPFVPDTLYLPTRGYADPALNPELTGKTPLQVLDLWMQEADRQGLYILLDFHSVSRMNQYFHWFVTDPNDFGLGKWVETYNKKQYTGADWMRDLVFVAKRYAKLTHFIGIDIFNEPHDRVRWNEEPTPEVAAWKPAAEKAAASILAANPNLLIFVQGITANWDGKEKTVPMNWGENLQPQGYEPLSIPTDKLVFAMHSYGPDVFVKSSFSAANYPTNLAADLETLFGYLSPRFAVVPGEWGGRYGIGGTGVKDVQWQDAFVDYLVGKGIRSSFYWCYTPNSSDTGGILNDDLTVREDKMTLLRKHWGV